MGIVLYGLNYACQSAVIVIEWRRGDTARESDSIKEFTFIKEEEVFFGITCQLFDGAVVCMTEARGKGDLMTFFSECFRVSHANEGIHGRILCQDMAFEIDEPYWRWRAHV